MWTIFHSIAGMNDDKVLGCEQIVNIMKLVKNKYKHLGKKVNLDSLCGNKYHRKELTAIKYIQAMKILQKWRNFKNMKIKLREQNGGLLIQKQLTLRDNKNRNDNNNNKAHQAAKSQEREREKNLMQNELFKDIEPSSYVDDNSLEYRPQQHQQQRSEKPESDIKETRLRNIKKQVDQRRE